MLKILADVEERVAARYLEGDEEYRSQIRYMMQEAYDKKIPRFKFYRTLFCAVMGFVFFNINVLFYELYLQNGHRFAFYFVPIEIIFLTLAIYGIWHVSSMTKPGLYQCLRTFIRRHPESPYLQPLRDPEDGTITEENIKSFLGMT